MIERIDYFIKNGKIVVFRCYGEGSVLELPGEIEGLPVAELADQLLWAGGIQQVSRSGALHSLPSEPDVK